MSRPKFANTTTSSSRRPKRDEINYTEKEINEDGSSKDRTSITAFMDKQKRETSREPTRPITLRFEESLWQQVESLRGPLSKNDFFKYLFDFYVDQHSAKD